MHYPPKPGYARDGHGGYAEVFRINPFTGAEERWYDYDDTTPDGKPAERVGVNIANAKDLNWRRIPPRPWLTANRLMRGQVTLLSGLGGVGKTALSITEGLSIATGRNLLDPSNTNPAWKICADRLQVYFYNLEDDLDELMRRVMAVMNFHNMDPSEVDDFLWLGDGTVDRLLLAVSEAGRKLVRTPQADQLIQVLLERRIDVLILDPFVKLHGCRENENVDMDFVMVVLKDIAIKAKCAIWLVCHSGKTGSEIDPHGTRGASSIPSAARVSETLTVPNRKERDRYGLGKDVIKLETTKANMSPLSDDVQWLRLRGHAVGNGDFAQVVELYAVKDVTDRMDEVLFDEIVNAISEGPPEGNHWVSKRGRPSWIGQALLAAGISNEDRANALIAEWTKLALLIGVEDARDDRNRPMKTAIQLNKVMTAKYRDERWGS